MTVHFLLLAQKKTNQKKRAPATLRTIFYSIASNKKSVYAAPSLDPHALGFRSFDAMNRSIEVIECMLLNVVSNLRISMLANFIARTKTLCEIS
jgi:hypothetical protein